MKNRISKLFAVGLTVTLLASLFAFGVPSASAATLSWTGEVTPSEADNVILPDSCISDIAVGGDGSTIWACSDDNLYKSTNEGATWSHVSVVVSDVNYSAILVAIAPDDNNYLAVVSDNTTPNPGVLITTNGGTTWGDLSGTLDIDDIWDIDIAGLSSGIHWVAIAGKHGGDASVQKWGIGGATPSWKDIADLSDGFDTDAGAAFALQFSPNFQSDQVLAVVTAEWGDNVSLQLYSQNSDQWNSAAGFAGYPATVFEDTTFTHPYAGDLELAPDYLASDDSLRLAFVGVYVNSTNSGIWRMDDNAAKGLKTGTAVKINSVAYDGATLVAGASDSNTTYYCTDATVSSPTVSTTRSYKRPGIDNESEDVVVAWAGADVVAGVGYPGAFSVSVNNGVAYNDISLVANELIELTDVFVSPDGSKTYLATSDNNYLSLWAYDTSWKRVLAVGSDAYFIVRQAPDDADIVYLAAQNDSSKRVFYTSDGGEGRWQIRSCNVEVQDLAVEGDGSVVYALTEGGRVSKSTNSGFTWGPTNGKATGLNGGFMIASAGEGKVIVGSDDGFVAFSTDSGDTWTKVIKAVKDGVSAPVVLTSTADLSEGGFIYAALQNSNTGIYRWPFGGANDAAWDTIKASTAAAYKAYGIAMGNGALYVNTSNGSDSATYRTLSPGIPKDLVGWSTMSTTAVLNGTPQGLRASAGSIKLWAINTEGSYESLYSYLDTLVGVSPDLVGPADNYTNPMNLINGYPSNIVFSWSKPSDEVLTYDVWIATDTKFDDTIIKTTQTAPTPVVSLQVTGDQFNQKQTYYWRVRVAKDGPIYSSWSAVRSFYIEPAAVTPPVQITQQPPPQITVTPPDVVVNVPPVVEVPPATTVTPAWIYVIIVIGALLLIAVIILIIRTRRAP